MPRLQGDAGAAAMLGEAWRRSWNALQEECLRCAQGGSSESPEAPSGAAAHAAAQGAQHAAAFVAPDLEAEREEYEDEGSDGEET